jgi:hypothetical protein
MDRLRQTDHDGVARLRLQTSSGTYSFHFPPLTQKVSTFVPRVSKKFMVEMYTFGFFFTTLGRFRPNVGILVDVLVETFSKFFAKIYDISKFRPMVGNIVDVSDGRPSSQGVCPSLIISRRDGLVESESSFEGLFPLVVQL